MQFQIKMCVVGMIAAGLCACMPEVLPTTSHAASTPDQIKIYQKEPMKYEKLGAVSLMITSTTRWENTADATPAFDQLKAQAAAKGANGILLIDDAKMETILVGARYQGGSYLVPVRQEPRSVSVQAIFVHE